MPMLDIPVETLIQQLHGPDWTARCDAARLLGQSGDPRAVDALLPGLSDPDWRVRRNAAQALGALRDKRALEPLLALLQDRTMTVRQRAIVALGILGATEAIPGMLDLLKDDELYGPRSSVYHAVTEAFQIFGGIGDEIKNAFPGNYPAMFNVGGAPMSLPEAMGIPGNDQSNILSDALSRFQTGFIRPDHVTGSIADAVHQAKEDVAWKFGVMFADAKDAKQDRVARLIELLKSDSNLKRSAAALTLPWYGDERSLEPLKQLLQDEDETTRIAATWAVNALQKAVSYRKRFGT